MDSDDGSLPSPPGPPKEPPPCLPPPLPARPPKTTPQPPIPVPQEPISFDIDQEVENDEISQQMTASYSEISFKSGLSPDIEHAYAIESSTTKDFARRPATLLCERAPKPLGPLTLEGSVHIEGNMTHFVAEDLEYKIKLSSVKKCETPPLSCNSKSGTPNSLYRQLLMPQVNQNDMGLLNDLECEAQRIAASIDLLTENLCGILHSISSLTADNVDLYKNAVSKMSDAMDSNIKSMYTMMAKAEEITQAMQSVHVHATRLKEIRKLVDLFESYI